MVEHIGEIRGGDFLQVNHPVLMWSVTLSCLMTFLIIFFMYPLPGQSVSEGSSFTL